MLPVDVHSRLNDVLFMQVVVPDAWHRHAGRTPQTEPCAPRSPAGDGKMSPWGPGHDCSHVQDVPVLY